MAQIFRSGTTKRIVFLIVAAAILAAGILMPTPEGLSYEGKMVITVLVAGIVLWISEAIPLFSTALLMLIAMPLVGVCGFEDAYKNTAGNVVFFLLACFTFTVVLDATTIPTRIVGFVLKWSGAHTKKMLFGFMVAVAVLSLVMSDVAACGTFVAVGKRLLELNHAEKGNSRLGKALMIGIPYASFAGGAAVMTGNGCNVLAASLFQQMFGYTITFAQWMMVGIPFAIILLLAGWGLLVLFFKPEAITQEAVDQTAAEVAGLPPLTAEEKRTCIIIVAALICWFLGSWISVLNTAMVGIVAVVLLSIPGGSTLEVKAIVSRINWGLIIMIMCILSVAHFIVETGAGDWMINGLVAVMPTGDGAWIIIMLALAAFGGIFHNVVPVGTACAAVFAYPFGIIATQMGIPMGVMVLLVAWQASFAYALPIDLVPVQTYNTGYYKMSDMVKVGVIMTIIEVILVSTFMPIAASFCGIA